MQNKTLIIKDLAIANGVVAKKPKNMSDDYWFNYEVPRIGKSYVKDTTILYGVVYDIDQTYHEGVIINADKVIEEDGECLSCKL